MDFNKYFNNEEKKNEEQGQNFNDSNMPPELASMIKEILGGSAAQAPEGMKEAMEDAEWFKNEYGSIEQFLTEGYEDLKDPITDDLSEAINNGSAAQSRILSVALGGVADVGAQLCHMTLHKIIKKDMKKIEDESREDMLKVVKALDLAGASSTQSILQKVFALMTLIDITVGQLAAAEVSSQRIPKP